MALATRPKPKTQHRKRVAKHHHHGKLYLKTYWPYLPMIGIVGVGALVNQALYGSSQFGSSAGAVIGAHNASLGSSSRLASLFGTQSNSIFLGVLLVSAIAFAVFTVSHFYRLHRLMNKKESFAARRPWLDIATVAVFTVGFILTRSGLPH